jgi:teichuronic acid biosynthesis glycosyltransferase TuaC
VPADRASTLRNGVDLVRFTPADRREARQRLGLDPERRLVLAVGHLVERKGPALVLSAFAAAHGKGGSFDLALVGKGELAQSLRQQAAELGVDAQLHMPGAVHPDVLADWYRAADVLVLASSREGWPNVVLEGLACGTPVIATRVWGTPEILTGCAAGRLVDRTVEDLEAALRDVDDLDPDAARPWAERHGWEETADAMQALFERLAS